MLQKITGWSRKWRTKVFRKKQIIRRIIIRRILFKVQSEYNMINLYIYKFSELICSFKSKKQQGERTKCANKHQNIKWKEITAIGSSRFKMHLYKNQQATSKRGKN